jgi:hypothetical protein
MNMGKILSVILLWAVVCANVGFTTSLAFAPGQAERHVLCPSCEATGEEKPSDATKGCQRQAQNMTIQADLTTAVKLQPKLDSPEAPRLLDEPIETLLSPGRSIYRASLARALPDRLAQEHIVLRI